MGIGNGQEVNGQEHRQNYACVHNGLFRLATRNQNESDSQDLAEQNNAKRNDNCCKIYGRIGKDNKIGDLVCLEYKGVGVKVTANSAVSDESLNAYAADVEKVKTFNVTNCYGALVPDGRTVDAREYGGSYFIAIEITGLTESVDIRLNAYATVNGETTATGVQTITLAYPAGN